MAPNSLTLGFRANRGNTPAQTPRIPMIAAMNGVQAPGNINMSDIIMIRAPVRNPIAGPKAKPVTNVRVSVRPILIRMPKNGVGLLKAKFPSTILPTAPTAIKAAVEVTCFDVNVRLSLQRHGWIIHPAKKPVVYSTLTFPIISSEQGCYEILPLKVGTVTSKSVCASLGARTREPKTQTREALLKGLPWIVVGSLFVCVRTSIPHTPLLVRELEKQFTETVHYRESKRILDIMDRVVTNRGIQRSDIIREATRYFLADNSQLTEQERIDVGSKIVDPTKRVEANEPSKSDPKFRPSR